MSGQIRVEGHVFLKVGGVVREYKNLVVDGGLGIVAEVLSGRQLESPAVMFGTQNPCVVSHSDTQLGSPLLGSRLDAELDTSYTTDVYSVAYHFFLPYGVAVGEALSEIGLFFGDVLFSHLALCVMDSSGSYVPDVINKTEDLAIEGWWLLSFVSADPDYVFNVSPYNASVSPYDRYHTLFIDSHDSNNNNVAWELDSIKQSNGNDSLLRTTLDPYDLQSTLFINNLLNAYNSTNIITLKQAQSELRASVNLKVEDTTTPAPAVYTFAFSGSTSGSAIVGDTVTIQFVSYQYYAKTYTAVQPSISVLGSSTGFSGPDYAYVDSVTRPSSATGVWTASIVCTQSTESWPGSLLIRFTLNGRSYDFSLDIYDNPDAGNEFYLIGATKYYKGVALSDPNNIDLCYQETVLLKFRSMLDGAVSLPQVAGGLQYLDYTGPSISNGKFYAIEVTNTTTSLSSGVVTVSHTIGGNVVDKYENINISLIGSAGTSTSGGNSGVSDIVMNDYFPCIGASGSYLVTLAWSGNSLPSAATVAIKDALYSDYFNISVVPRGDTAGSRHGLDMTFSCATIPKTCPVITQVTVTFGGNAGTYTFPIALCNDY